MCVNDSLKKQRGGCSKKIWSYILSSLVNHERRARNEKENANWQGQKMFIVYNRYYPYKNDVWTHFFVWLTQEKRIIGKKCIKHYLKMDLTNFCEGVSSNKSQFMNTNINTFIRMFPTYTLIVNNEWKIESCLGFRKAL